MKWLSIFLVCLTPALAQATLQAAVSLDGGASLTLCDQNLCAGGGVPTFPDTNPAVGILGTAAGAIGPVTVSFTVQTSVKATTAGTLNTLSSAGTVIENTDGVAHTLQLTIWDTDFLGPAFEFTSTGSGTWVDDTLPAAFGGSTITMEWWNDPANAQGANTAGDTPGLLVNSATFTPIDGVSLQSFGGPGGPFNVSGAIVDPGLFSMTLDNELVLGPGIRLESRGQALSKPLIAVPMPPSAWLLLLGGLVGLRRRSAA
jgi:hypothetical protein